MSEKSKPSVWEVPPPFKEILDSIPSDSKSLFLIQWLHGHLPACVRRVDDPTGQQLLKCQRSLAKSNTTVQTLSAREMRSLVFDIGKAVGLIPEYLLLTDE